MISNQDELDIRNRYDANVTNYASFSEHIVSLLTRHKKSNPTQVRLVFSRDPSVKEWGSLIKKISDKREKKNPGYGFDDLEDLVAVTVLCPYKSDAREFIEWLKSTFDVQTKDPDANRNDPSGHRGFHYICALSDNGAVGYADFNALKFEVQIKTLLEEAFDAKTHDLTYKPGERAVSPELKNQFGMLSSALRVIDDQSEFLKGLIQEEEREKDFRRRACVRLYLNDDDAHKAATKLKINVTTLAAGDVSSITDKLRRATKKRSSSSICKLAALCALDLRNDYLRVVALGHCDRLYKETPDDFESSMVTAAIRWALGDFKRAIEDISVAVALAEKSCDESASKKAKNAFVYLVSDWKSYGRKDKQDWNQRAHQFAGELSVNGDDYLKDTLGYFCITFGTNPDQIDYGRKLIREAKVQSGQSDFYRYHEFIALRALRDMLD